MNELKTQIDVALKAPHYNYLHTIDALKQIPEFKRAYSLLNSRKRSYTLEYHTIMVCNLFENLFAADYSISNFKIASLRLLLCLHDIGKPISILDNNKSNQGEYTTKMIEKNKRFFPFSEEDYNTTIALISDDPLGLYIRNKISLSEAITKLNRMLKNTALDAESFFHLLLIFYQVDAGSYTRQGYIGPDYAFIEKPKLEAVFKKNINGELIYSFKYHRLLFSEREENKIKILAQELGAIYG